MIIFQFHKIIISIISITSLSFNLSATNYCISNTGDNDALGTSPEQAWETIEKVNSTSFLPGDSILFERGGIWRGDALRISSSGNNENRIVYGAFGTGQRPEILGSVLASDWTNITGNIWASSAHILLDPWTIGYDGPQIFFEENDNTVSWGLHQSYNASYSNLSNEYDWTWSDSKIYIYSPSDPNTRYSEIEVPQRAQGIYLLDHNYISIDNLTIKYCGDAGIYDQYSTIQLYGLRVTNCEIGFIGKKDGGAAYGLSVHHSDSYYAFNEIYNCGRRGISITLYDTDPITQSNVIIEHNLFHHGWHTTSLDGSITAGHTIENIIFRNNLIEGDPDIVLGGENSNSNHVFMSNQSSAGGSVRNIQFYNNIFTFAHGSSIKIGSVENVKIYNNTFYNFNPTLSNWQAHAFCGSSTNIDIINNIFCNNATDNRWAAIECHNTTVNELNVDYNLYYNTDSTRRMFWIDGGTSYDIEQWDNYRTATGNDLHSPKPKNPDFVNAPNDFRPQAGSPAIGRGVVLEGITRDFNNFPISHPPDIGALQYESIAGISTVNSHDRIIIFPNPANDYCNISVNAEKYSFRIFNLQGKMVYHGQEYIGAQTIRLPLNNLSAGIYFLQTSSNSSDTETIKLIKQ